MKKLLILPALLISTASYGSHSLSGFMGQYPILIPAIGIGIGSFVGEKLQNPVTTKIAINPLSCGIAGMLGAVLLKEIFKTSAPDMAKHLFKDFFIHPTKKNPYLTAALVCATFWGPKVFKELKSLPKIFNGSSVGSQY